VVIVDDLAQSGATLLECAVQLKKFGATAVSAYVTHVVFPNEAEKKFIAQDGQPPVLQHFFTTNTLPTVADRVKKLGPPFEILSIGPMVLDILLDDTL
jgi:phosphoribosylpyrophosphate synthetase